MNKRKLKKIGIAIFTIVFFIVIGIAFEESGENENIVDNKISYEINSIPEYNGKIYVEINNNIPKFSEKDTTITQDYYSNLKNGKVRYGND